jgi:hypothetical protein
VQEFRPTTFGRMLAGRTPLLAVAVMAAWRPGVRTRNLLIPLVVLNLVCPAPPTLALSIKGRHVIGIIRKVDAQAREAELLPTDRAKPLRFTWDRQTQFVPGRFVDPAMLRPGALVEISCYHPFFGDTYARKVKLLSGSLQQTERTPSCALPVAAPHLLAPSDSTRSAFAW